jgi:outer membrane protein assembly factor BamD
LALNDFWLHCLGVGIIDELRALSHNNKISFHMSLSQRRLITALLLPIAALTIATTTGCGSAKKKAPQSALSQADKQQIALQAESQLYARARLALDKGSYDTALALYEVLETRFPFTETARQAQLESAFVYYKLFNNEAALTNANRFITQYPRHENVDYAYFIKGLVGFRGAGQGTGGFMRSDKTLRDPSSAREGFFAFSQLVNRYPQSIYAADARQRMIFLRDRLARHQWHIIEYYKRKNAWVAVAARSKQLVEDFEGSSYVTPALKAMVEAYTELGINDLAANAKQVLAANMGDSSATVVAATATEPTPNKLANTPEAIKAGQPESDDSDQTEPDPVMLETPEDDMPPRLKMSTDIQK